MRTWVQLGTVGAALAAAVVPLEPATVERWYSTGLYPLVQRTLTPFSNVVPFAWFDVLTIGAGVTVLVLLVRATRVSWRTRRIVPLVVTLGHLATAAAVVYLVFLVVWGFNYRRVPMLVRLDTRTATPGPGDLLALGRTAVEELNALYAAAHAGGWPVAPWRDERLRREFAMVQRLLSDAPPAEPGRLKASIYGPYFRWTSVDGMVNPFALEVIGNPDLLPFEQPFVAAHEWAHLAGYADESEASFVGWLSCIRADAPSAYSGWLFLYWQLRASVGAADRAQLADMLAAGPAGDVDAIAERLRRGRRPRLQTASWRVYDQYLKTNRVEQGVASYSDVITLLLRARFDAGWTPVRR
jgi:hypothetical protein